MNLKKKKNFYELYSKLNFVIKWNKKNRIRYIFIFTVSIKMMRQFGENETKDTQFVQGMEIFAYSFVRKQYEYVKVS